MARKSERDTSSGKGSPQNTESYRSFIGPADKYDLFSALQFNLLTFLGLRGNHFLLDIGCGSLRGGKLFIPYLAPGHYFGVEPQRWLVQKGIEKELGSDIIRLKKPEFLHDDNFTLRHFNRKFDFLLAQSVFSHASQAQIASCLSEAKEVMKADTIFAATFAKGDENYSGDKWTIWATYRLDHMEELVKEAGLLCKSIPWPHPDMQQWILIFRPEAESRVSKLTNVSQLPDCRMQLEFCEERLSKIENHPAVQMVLRVNRAWKLLGFFLNRIVSLTPGKGR